MIVRLTSPSLCRQVTNKYPDYFTFDEDAWLSDLRNHAYIQNENIAFAEFKSEGFYFVHFCFDTAKGRQAIDLSNAMLDCLAEDTDWKTVVGIIEKRNKKALWACRKLGFISMGDVITKDGLCESFYRNRN